MRSSKIIVVALLLLASFTPIQARASTGGPSGAVMEKAIQSVGQVIATRCNGPGSSRAGSGFVWDTDKHFVTDIHVISHCESVVVHISGMDLTAMPVRALPFADLALLELQKPAGAKPLKMAATSPAVNDRLQALGYAYGEPTYDNTGVTVKLGEQTLKAMVSDKVRDILVQAGSPSLDVGILRLDGSLHPGLSGAPLINDNGEVVGIGSGGLENGTANISWAVQARYLNELAKASLPTDLPFPASGAVFSMPVVGQGSRKVKCGEASFVYTKTRMVGDLIRSADDVTGFYQIAATTGMAMDQLKSVKLDVYAEEAFGGSIAIPEGATLQSHDDLCVAQLADQMKIEVSASTVSNLREVQSASEDFENAFDQGGFAWQVDPSFSYLAPYQRLDGLVVRRKNFFGTATGGQAMWPTADLFETLMTRDRSFIGIRAVNENFVPSRYLQCHAHPEVSSCGSANDAYLKWVAAVLGLQLSTFPPR